MNTEVDPAHILVRLADSIDWTILEARFSGQFLSQEDPPALPVRMMAALAVLRLIYDLPDGELLQRWTRDPCYQYFCGVKRFSPRAPFDETLLAVLPPPRDPALQTLVRECVTGLYADADIHSGMISSPQQVARRSAEAKASAADADDKKSDRKKTSIYDVAKYAGVSIKTVSLVINHRPNVSAKTRAAVLEAIEALSYHPNVFARGLASEHSFLIALIYEHPSASYISEIQLGALDRCRVAGYHLVLETLDAHAEDAPARLHRLLSSSGIHGVILPPPLCDSQPILDELLRSHVSCVRITAGAPVEGLATLGIDERKAGYDVTAYLISLGHKRIGFIKGNPDHIASDARFLGYRDALAAFDLPFDPKLCAQGFFTFQSGKEAAEYLLSNANPPTAIFAANDDMAAGTLVTAQRAHIRIPDELSVVGFDDSVAARYAWPQLTTCRQPVREMGAEAISLLLKKQGVANVAPVILPHELVVRDTTARPWEGDAS